jgi:3-hydroxyacyl-CoA dehydrogenase
MTATYRTDGDVAIITIESPPVNGLSLAVRKGIADGLKRAHADATVRAIVLRGNARGFSGGADIREFGRPEALAEPTVWTVIDAIDSAAKPVVAAIHTICMGGGLELALGCHYRVVAPDCVVAFPEINLGLLPGAGGTQRMPRALGVEAALNLILTGERVAAESLAAQPGQRLFDLVAGSKETMDEEAIALARRKASESPAGGHPRLRDMACSHPRGAGYFQFVRNMLPPEARALPAPAACIDAVEAAATRGFDAGSALERRLFLQLMDTAEARAFRHAFLAERAAAQVNGVVAGTPVREIRSVAVVGGGTMGCGIALSLLDAGLPVMLLETGSQTLDRAVERVLEHYALQIKKGRIDAAGAEQRRALLSPTLDYAALANCDLVIEAVFEEMSVKEAVFRRLDAVMRPGAILASNTSTMDLDAIAAFTGRPRDVVGLHFFSPANIMRLLEVIRGRETSADVLATVMTFAKRIRKTAVVSGVCDGFIGNRMFEEYYRQAGFLLDEGASPQQVDRAMTDFGMAMGPFAVGDLAGNDIGWAIRRRRAVDRPGLVYSTAGDRLYELGRHGQKANAGWYDYAPGGHKPMPSATVREMLDAHRKALGISPRKIQDTEIVERLVLALVNEGARILEEGISARSGDIDTVYLAGYGFPARRGGPMQYASEIGLYNVAESMRRLRAEVRVDTAFWKPAALIERLVDEAKAFS